MKTTRERLADLGTAIPDILVPTKNIDREAWAVVACDQFTQDRDYWKRVEEFIGIRPSTLRVILPEVFLEDGDRAERVAAIHAAMASYMKSGIFDTPISGIMYIERKTPRHERRRGLVLSIDLERYQWAPEARPLIRATEGTVRERIPPRMEIRRGAPLETPHILLLIDDDERALVEGLGEKAMKREPLYESQLMLGAGSIRGWILDSEEDWAYLADKLERLRERAAKRYANDGDGETPFLYAVGDGNHSLATAKAVWDEYKTAHGTDENLMSHPARWALVEVENIYDEGIEFEPIHRVLFGTTLQEIVQALKELPGFATQRVTDVAILEKLVSERSSEETRYGLVSKDGCLLVKASAAGIATEPLQPILDAFVGEKKGRNMDYLHGSDETIRVAMNDRDGLSVGIILPPIDKSDLFATVARSGPLPRKSFSMGEAIEKRFYLECRELFG